LGPHACWQAEEGAAKAGSVLDKIKDALPFGTLPTFELAVSNDDATMGPNEARVSTLSVLDTVTWAHA
jgi:hypothetical protein